MTLTIAFRTFAWHGRYWITIEGYGHRHEAQVEPGENFRFAFLETLLEFAIMFGPLEGTDQIARAMGYDPEEEKERCRILERALREMAARFPSN